MSIRRSLDKGPSSREPLLATRTEDENDDGPAPQSPKNGDVVLDVFQQRTADARHLPPLAKHRPLNLADDYEIVGGIPAFLWKHPDDFTPESWLYTFSADGSRMAVQTHSHSICVYDVTDNFLILSTGDNIGTVRIMSMAFWNHSNNRLLVCYDGSVQLFAISEASERADGIPGTKADKPEELKPLKKHEVISDFKHASDLRFEIRTFEFATWICGWDSNDVCTIYACCLDKEGIFKKTKIASTKDIMPIFVHTVDSHKTLVGVETYAANPEQNRTRIWTNLDFNKAEREDDAIEIKGQALEWSGCEEYFIVWEVVDVNTQYVKVYSMSNLKAHENHPSFQRKIAPNTLDSRACFLKNTETFQKKYKTGEDEDVTPLIGYLTIQKEKVLFTIWSARKTDIHKEFDLTMKEMESSDNARVNFCISSNMKWMATSYWSTGMINLFSLNDGVLIWSKRFEMNPKWSRHIIPMGFDPASSKLIINSHRTLYGLAPACFVEDHDIDYQCSVYDMDVKSSNSSLDMNPKHQRLMTRRILWWTFNLKESPLEKKGILKKLDVTSSNNSDKVALLVKSEKALFVVSGPLNSTLNYWHQMTLLNDNEEHERVKDMKKIKVSEMLSYVDNEEQNRYYWTFFYIDKEEQMESIVVFFLKKSVVGFCKSLKGKVIQEPLTFSSKEGYFAQQTKNKERIAIVQANGVVIIDLSERKVVYDVLYPVNLGLVFKEAKKDKLLFATISADCTSILLGWDPKMKQRITVTKASTENNFENLGSDSFLYYECRPLGNDFEQVVSYELDEEGAALGTIFIRDNKNSKSKLFTRKEWNIQMTRNIYELNKGPHCTPDFTLDESSGIVWMMVWQRSGNQNDKLWWIPFGPYSMEDCLSNLYMLDYPQRQISSNELDEAMKMFGISFITMPLHKETNFEVAYANKNGSLMLRFLDFASKKRISLENICCQCWRDETFSKRLKQLIEEKDEALVKFFMDLMEKNYIPFEENAKMIEECFTELWLEYRPLVEPMLCNDILVWKLGEINILSNILHDDKKYLKYRTWTDDSSKWIEARNDDVVLESYWEDTSTTLVSDLKEKWSPTKEKVILKLFCMKNICKIGRKGILRFLLMQEAPSYIYKTLLVKWVIIWKWEHVWKDRCKKDLYFYVAFTIGFSAYAICIGYVGKDLENTLWSQVVLPFFVVAFMVYAFLLLRKEWIQVYTYTKDGERLFRDDKYWGIKQYAKSMWNIIEVFTYVLLLTIIPGIHFICIFESSILDLLLSFVATEVLLIWIKFWYFAQAFQRTGALVLLIENVVKDLQYFLLLAFLILVGFSCSLFMLFQPYLKDHKDYKKDENEEADEDEILEKTKQSFGSPVKAMLTLFYAMVGTFEPEVYIKCGALSPIIIIFFLIYLAIEMIVMLNMLIAIMGDTFDRVKDTEEVQLLMGRARLIDAYEASLTANQIEEIEAEAKPYLLVLLSPDEDQDKDDVLWTGRVKTIEKRVKRDIIESKENVIKKIDEIAQNNSEEINSAKKQIIQKVQQDMKQQIQERQIDMKEQTLQKLQQDIQVIQQVQQDIKQELQDVRNMLAPILSSLTEGGIPE